MRTISLAWLLRPKNAVFFSEPGDRSHDPTTLKPPADDLDAARPLIDWRAWHGGPCVIVQRFQAGREAVQQACEAVNAGNFSAANREIRNAGAQLENSNQPEGVAVLADTLGMLELQYGTPDNAIEAFKIASQVWEALDRAPEFSATLHNMASAVEMKGTKEYAGALFYQVFELRSLLNDEPGRHLAGANSGRIFKQGWLLDEANSYFEGNELPRAAVTRVWKEATENQ
jgi:hypothetical protein